MPLYRYVCENCGAERVELRSVEERDKPKTCECGGKMSREYSSSFAIEIRAVTGCCKVSIPGATEPVYVRKHRNWTPPKEFVKRKMPPRVF